LALFHKDKKMADEKKKCSFPLQFFLPIFFLLSSNIPTRLFATSMAGETFVFPAISLITLMTKNDLKTASTFVWAQLTASTTSASNLQMMTMTGISGNRSTTSVNHGYHVLFARGIERGDEEVLRIVLEVLRELPHGSLVFDHQKSYVNEWLGSSNGLLPSPRFINAEDVLFRPVRGGQSLFSLQMIYSTFRNWIKAARIQGQIFSTNVGEEEREQLYRDYRVISEQLSLDPAWDRLYQTLTPQAMERLRAGSIRSPSPSHHASKLGARCSAAF
jgi:hypothetical protein